MKNLRVKKDKKLANNGIPHLVSLSHDDKYTIEVAGDATTL